MLYELGPHISVLRLLGCAASRAFVEVPDWKAFLFTLFERLGSLQCFETSQDATVLVRAASQSQQEEQQNVCDGVKSMEVLAFVCCGGQANISDQGHFA